jgi:hypothetical protein
LSRDEDLAYDAFCFPIFVQGNWNITVT